VQDIHHLVRVVLVHLAAEGFDKYFFGHGGFYKSGDAQGRVAQEA
jgi:hypothetical protein